MTDPSTSPTPSPLPNHRQGPPLKVLFLSSDTGGGHRASAESLAQQLVRQFPGSTYDLLDVCTNQPGVVWPYRELAPMYQHMFSAHPRAWQAFYHATNSRFGEWVMYTHSTWTCEAAVRKLLAGYDVDAIVSVHPGMNYVPLVATRKLRQERNKYIPFFTVVTDLAEGHFSWFQPDADKIYVASEQMHKLAHSRRATPTAKVHLTGGLPIRHAFAEAAEQLGDRTTAQGQAYQQQVRLNLKLKTDYRMILVMGGGEGVGSLATIVEECYRQFVRAGVNVTICVVCGRNETLQQQFHDKDWSKVLAAKSSKMDHCCRGFGHQRKESTTQTEPTIQSGRLGHVQVIPLGYIANMADYMVAADALITKAGPGTIAEAAALGLPVMLTSFLPGQEAANVEYVTQDKGFGAFHQDPIDIASEVTSWCQHPTVLEKLSRRAKGNPTAAAEIIWDIGTVTHQCLATNKRVD